jgi:hypothetical protein
MARAAQALLEALDEGQRARFQKSFEDANRTDWHFVPRARQGLPLKDMNPLQRERAHALVQSALSDAGYAKFTGNLVCERVLAELEKNPVRRDVDLYYFTLFGQPGGAAPWGWRVEGHHLSQNFTVVDHTLTATTPSFWGANPARVTGGPHDGHRPLAAEEDLARALARSLTPAQRAQAVLAEKAPPDILTGNKLEIRPLEPAGLPASALDAAQQEQLAALLHTYLDNMEADLSAARRQRLTREGFDRITFAWAGGLDPGQGHYYRIQGPSFLIEYDNTQNRANHIHAVWRDFAGDFGRDLLREHLRQAHGAP